MTKKNILVVEGETAIAEWLENQLQALGHRVAASISDAQEALRQARRTAPDLVLMDAQLPGDWDGVTAGSHIQTECGVPVVYLAGCANAALLARIEDAAPYGFIAKPIHEAQLRISLEIAFRRRAEEKASSLEARLNLLAEKSSAVIFSAKPEDGFPLAQISANVADIAGYSREEFLADRALWARSIHPDDLARVKEHLAAALAADGERALEYRLRRGDGEYRWLLEHHRLLRDNRGRPVEVAGFCLDITERKRAEEALRQSEKHYRLLAENIDDVIWAMDENFRFTYLSPSIVRLTGFAPEELLGKTIRELVAPQSMEAVGRAREIRMEKERAGNYDHVNRLEVRYLRKDGGLVWTEVLVRSLFDVTGRRSGYVGVSRDITERRRAEQALRESEERFSTLFFLSPQIAALSDLEDGRYLEVNDVFLKALGYEREELVGRTSLELGVFEDASERERMINILEREGGIQSQEARVRRKDGSTWTGLFSAVPVVLGGKKRLLSLAVDISDRKAVEEESDQARKRAEAASKAKSAFMARLSHEIRTPLNSILGLTEMLGEENLNARQRGLTRGVGDACDLLLSIVNDALSFSTIEAGGSPPEALPFDPVAILEETARIVAPQAQAKGLKVKTRVAPGVPPAVLGDAGRIRQILANLSGNAVKFTERGWIELKLDPDPQRDGFLRYEVVDTGVGVASHAKDAVFEEFFRLPDHNGRYGGAGLGLAIAKGLAEAMGGDIALASEIGQGSRFVLSLPLPALDPGERAGIKPPQPRRESEPQRALRLLLAEDNQANVSIVQLFLENSPHRLTVAGNGREALDLFREGRYDVALMDIDMPVMDGFEAARRIRELEREQKRARVPIIALTAHAFQEYRTKMSEAGCDDFLVKPFRARELLEAISRNVQGRSAEAAAQGAQSEPPLPIPARPEGDMVRVGRALKPIVPAFLEIQEKNLTKMRVAAETRDHEDLRRQGHNLKGAALTYGFLKMAAFGEDLEKAAQAHDREAIARLLQDLTNHFKKLSVCYVEMPDEAPAQAMRQDSP